MVCTGLNPVQQKQLLKMKTQGKWLSFVGVRVVFSQNAAFSSASFHHSRDFTEEREII